MKITIEHDTDGDQWLTIYNPDDVFKVMTLADRRGWCPQRRYASQFVPEGEVIYSQARDLNDTFDELIEHLCNQAHAELEGMPE